MVSDTNYLVRNAMATGYHIASLVVPPVYIIAVMSRRGRASFSVNRLLYATWVGGLSGAAMGGGIAYAWYSTCNTDYRHLKRLEAAYDTDRIRVDDHAIIGSILLSVLTTGLFWKRAGAVNLILGGAGLGSNLGLLAHFSRSFAGDPPPHVVPKI